MGARRHCCCVMRIDVRHDDVGALRHRCIRSFQRLLKLPELIIARRAEHDHPVAEHELSVGDGFAFSRHH